MSTNTCPKCLAPRQADRPLCKSCSLIEQGLIKGLAEEQAAATQAFLNNTDELTYAEAGAFEEIARQYGAYVLPETANNSRVRPGPKDPRKNPPKFRLIQNEADIPQHTEVPAGFGTGNVTEIRGAIDAEKQRKVLQAHEAWMSMEEKALDQHHRRQSQARHVVLLAATLAGLGGFALGAGIMSVIFFLITGGHA